MANFGKFKITNDGIDIEYKAQTGKKLEFTKFVLGDGEYTGDVLDLTYVVNEIMTVDIKRLDIQTLTSMKKVTIGFNLNTTDVETGFYLREIGLFAKDPDTSEEKLVFYGNSGTTADYISPSTGTTISEKLIDLKLYISNVNNITAVIDSSLTYATIQDFENFKNNVSGYAPTSTELTLIASNWVYNSQTGYYEYRITDETVTSYDLAMGNMTIENQNKLKNGYINTFDGYLIIYTTKNPGTDINITITVWKTTDTVEPEMTQEEVDELVNEAFEEV